MPAKKTYPEVPVDMLRWRLDPATLPFESTADLEPLTEIVGQERGVEAFNEYLHVGCYVPPAEWFRQRIVGRTIPVPTIRKLP